MSTTLQLLAAQKTEIDELHRLMRNIGEKNYVT